MGRLDSQGTVEDVVAQYIRSAGRNEINYNSGPIKEVNIKQILLGLELSFRYELIEPMDAPFLGFVISDVSGNPICGGNPRISGANYMSSPRSRGVVRVVLRQPQLVDGTYTLSIWFGDGIKDLFECHEFLSFDIHGMAPNTQSLNGGLGCVFPVCDWDFT
jgi:hypothetical protein